MEISELDVSKAKSLESNKGRTVKKLRKRKAKQRQNVDPLHTIQERQSSDPLPTVHAWWRPYEKYKSESNLKEEDSINIMIKFFTKQEQYSVSSAPVSIKSNSTVEDLNGILREFLKQGGIVKDVPEFEFLVGGRLVSTTIQKHLQNLSMAPELTTEVEFFERTPPPSPKDCLEHDDWVSSVRSCGDWLITGCYDNTVQVWSVSKLKGGLGRRANTLVIPAHQAPVKGVSWIDSESNVKTFVSCSIDQRALVWEWDSDANESRCLICCVGHTESVECIDSLPDQNVFATGSWDNSVKIWNADPKKVTYDGDGVEKKKIKLDQKVKRQSPLMTLVGHGESVSGIKWIDFSNLLSCSWDHSIRLWDVEEAKMSSQINCNVSVFALDYSRLNQTVLAACADRYIRMYDHRQKEGNVVMRKYLGHRKWASGIRWCPYDENLFVSGSFDWKVKIWDRRNCESSLYELGGHNDKVLSVDWSATKQVSSGSADCTSQVYEV